MPAKHDYNESYAGAHLDRIAFPMGGIGAGMICLEGTGALSHVSLRHQPDVFKEPLMMAALSVKQEGCVPRLLEGPVPKWKAFGPSGSGNGANTRSYGLPRFRNAEFAARFPFADITLSDPTMPVDVSLTGWSPFVPGSEDDSSLPLCALEYTFTNTSTNDLEAVFSFHSVNICGTPTSPDVSITPVAGGFAFQNPGSDDAPWDESGFAAFSDAPGATADCAWFRGGWFDPVTMVWKTITECDVLERPPHTDGAPGNGASLYVPLELSPGEARTVKLMLCWYTPRSNIRLGPNAGSCDPGSACCEDTRYAPWYAARFTDIDDVIAFWRSDYGRLRQASVRFRDCFYDTTLPGEVIEAVAANLTILKSPTCLRQSDGRFWAWEGCCDTNGCCAGTCTHVWNYAQAVPHLFPALERSLRETEFTVSQDERGHQTFRAALPIRPPDHGFHAASDGQLGGIMKAYREWRVSGDTEWIKALWPAIKQSLAYCIEAWDPRHKGVLEEPHHNTYDIEFWGPGGMCSSFYLGALKAATLIGNALDEDVTFYEELFAKGKQILETDLFDGEYFIQEITWQGLRAPDPAAEGSAGNRGYTPEARALLECEGPKYQYGTGCISDGVLGAWIAEMCGLGETLDPAKVASHVSAVHRYNLKDDLSDHANPQRPSYAIGNEGGLLLCTWPKGGALSLPFVYSNEVWTGIEYQVASHLMLMGHVAEGLEIVRACRDRYDGRVRNPFNEYECGHWYARAMSSYGMLQTLAGARYDAVERVLYLHPQIDGDFRAFLATATGYGTVGVRGGEPFLDVVHGTIAVERLEYVPAG